MNQSLRRAVQSICTLQQFSGKSRLLNAGRYSAPIITQQDGRGIRSWEWDRRLVLTGRKKVESFKYPEKTIPHPRYTYSDWNYKAEIYAFGKRLQENFKDEILREALTDQSYISKERQKQEELGIDTSALDLKNNGSLAQLGYQISTSTLLEFLRKELPDFPTEGHHALIEYLTCMDTMSNVASNLGLKDLILCQEYPPSSETYTRAMFAVIGAVEKSSGLERAKKFVVDFLASLLCSKDINEIWDIPRPWEMMVNIAKQKGLYPVEGRIIGDAGRNTIHAVFLVGIYDKNKQLLGKAPGETIDIALEMAARDVLKTFFNTRDPRPPFEFQSANIPYTLVPHVRNIHKNK